MIEPNLSDTPQFRWRFDTVTFDEARMDLRVAGTAVEMEQKPLQVLAVLLRHAGEVVSKRELLDTVWAGRVTVEHVLATAVGKLRKALGEASGRIVTVPRIGYRFEGAPERVAVGRQPLSLLALAPGQAVPGRTNFRLQEQLGSGHGSEVWVARHAKTGERRVFKFAPDSERLAALKREATLARLLKDTLPGRNDFARVLDWNFEREPYYLECQYGGLALNAWVENGGLSRLSQTERLALFLRIAGAAAAAHGVGVLHKDLKPANVLVEAQPAGGWQVRLTDFGSSRLLQPQRLEALGITALGFTLPDGMAADSASGTPLYLAPEVIAGQASTVQSDVYALGVLLYQLLVGDLQRVMAPGWERDISDPLLREDIALATDVDPARRLASVVLLTERLEHLPERHAERARTAAAEAQLAESRRALERARARRPWMAAAAFTLLLGLAASISFAVQTQSARRAAETQAARAEAVSGFLQDILVSADRGAPGVGYDLTVREALARASQALETRFAGAPSSEAAVRLTAGHVYGSLGEFDAAVDHLRRAVALLASTRGSLDAATLDARYRLGSALAGASRYDEAQDVLNAADEDAARQATVPAVDLAGARAWSRFHLVQARAADAVPYLELAERLLLAGDQQDPALLHAVRVDLSQAYSHLGRFDEAVARMEVAAASPYARTASPSQQAWTTFLHGAALLYSGRLEEAGPRLEQAVADLSATWGPDTLQTAQAQGALGNLHFSAGRFAEAVPYIAAARATLCGLNGADHQACLQQSGNEGIARLHGGDPSGAMAQLAAARDGFERRWGITSPGTQVFGYYLATAHLDAGDADAAEAVADTLNPELLAAGSPGTQWESRVQALRGAILVAQGHPSEGVTLLAPAVAAMEADGTQSWVVEPFRRHLDVGGTVHAGGGF